MNSRSYAVWALPVLAALVLACAGGGAPAKPVENTRVLSPIDVAKVVRAPIASGPRISGSLEAGVQAVLRAEAGGTVTAVNAELGDAVASGFLLAKVDNRGVTGSVTSARSSVTAAQQDLENARRDLERTQKLSAAGAVSGRDVEVAGAMVAAAEARVQQARAGLASAGEQLDGVIVKSPIAGVVSARTVSLGDVVAPGTPLFTVIDPSTLRLEAAVPAAAISEVHPGGKVVFTVQGYGERAFEGVIERVAPAVDPVTRQLTILVSVPNADGALISGLFAEGRVAGELHDGLIVPADAIDETGPAPAVLVIRNNQIERAEIKVGSADLGNEQVEVTSGLVEGDAIVVGPARSTPVGTPVELKAGG